MRYGNLVQSHLNSSHIPFKSSLLCSLGIDVFVTFTVVHMLVGRTDGMIKRANIGIVPNADNQAPKC